MVTVHLLRPFLALAAFLSLTTAVADLGNVWVQTGGRDAYPIIWTQAFTSAILGGQWGQASALSLILMPALIVTLSACFHLFEPLLRKISHEHLKEPCPPSPPPFLRRVFSAVE